MTGLAAAAVLAVTLAAPPAPAAATGFTDARGDYLASFTGPRNADLDILTGSVGFDTNSLLLSITVAGAVGDTSGSAFLWGVNRGAGTNRLITSGPPAVGPATILLDAVVRLNADGTGAVVAFPSAGAPTTTFLAPGAITVLGDTISARIPRALLPSTGFAFADYTYIGWSRSALGPQTLIADLAPDDRSVVASFVPEPGTWAMLIAGFGIVGMAARRRRVAAA